MQALIKKFSLAKIVSFTLKNFFPLLLPSHNCIIIHNVQFSRYNFELPKKFNEVSSCNGTSVNFLKKEVVGQGLAFLRKSHGGCNSPPDCCQEPPFESILAFSHSELCCLGLDSYLGLI